MLGSDFCGAVSGSTLQYPVSLNNCYFYPFIFQKIRTSYSYNTPTNYSYLYLNILVKLGIISLLCGSNPIRIGNLPEFLLTCQLDHLLTFFY